jgi:uncharacterized protein YbaR (Trm112 family)
MERKTSIMENTAPSQSHAQIDPELLDMLRCPLTRSRLRLEGQYLIAEVGGLGYPVRDGIPVMLIEEAKLPAGIASLDEFKKKFSVAAD